MCCNSSAKGGRARVLEVGQGLVKDPSPAEIPDGGTRVEQTAEGAREEQMEKLMVGGAMEEWMVEGPMEHCSVGIQGGMGGRQDHRVTQETDMVRVQPMVESMRRGAMVESLLITPRRGLTVANDSDRSGAQRTDREQILDFRFWRQRWRRIDECVRWIQAEVVGAEGVEG